MLKYYKIVVNEGDDTGVDFNAFVDVPAHLKGFIAFGKVDRYQFNDEKRIVTGVMISVGTPIYRNSEDLGEHYVVFDAQTVDLIRRKFFMNGYNVNLNKQHDPNQVTNGAVLIDSYLISSTDSKLPNAPEAFKHMNLQDGSWIASYKVTDDKLWEEVKSGKFNGFSVEGWFEKVEIKTKHKMKKQNKTIWDLFKSAPKKADKFATATTADGVVISYEGELVEGTAVFVELEGEQVPAPAGEYQLTWEDGNVTVITVDDNGLVVSVAPVEMDNENQEEEMQEIRQEVADAIANFASQVHTRFEALEKQNTELVSENVKLKSEIETFKASGKFGANPKQTQSEEKKMTIAQIVANKKS